MNRWQVTYLGKPFMLYGNTAEEVIQKYSDTIDEGSNVILIPYPQELFDKLTELPVRHRDNKGREYREINCGAGYCVYRMSKDEQDGQYYDLIQYRRSGGRLIEPCLWSCCTAQEFADMWLKEIPVKECGFVISLNEVKKLCGKMLFRIGKYHVWRDSDGYYYVGCSSGWNKYFKEEYKRMSVCRDTAVCVEWVEGYHYNQRWFENKEAWEEYRNTIVPEPPSYKILRFGYKKLSVEDRKLICRLNYMNIERELKSESPELVIKMWARYQERFGNYENICKGIVEKVREQNES